ncbi:MAG: CRTAC1 family protein [Sedimentisphaerales bacterium]|nr:CRTAC1 family protein [Sedimentisphaerales bacterium]
MSTICRAQRIILTDVTNQTGITFVHTDGSFGKRYMMENVTAGIALLDYDNDGDVDIYFVNGGILEGNPSKERPANALYRNEGGWKFTDVTAEAGVGDTGHGLGVAAGDYDNDGDLDIYLNNHGPNVLYRNNGDGTFTDVTEQAGVSNGNRMGAGTCFLDADKDGDLDLYVSNYVVFDYKAHVIRTRKGHPYYTGPPNYPTTVDTMFRNNGDGTFKDVTMESGIGSASGSGMGMVCADYDNDGDTDIFVANDVGPNFLWQNDGTGKFEEIGLISGFAYDLHGEEYGSMGPDCGDYDNDGLLDIYLTSYAKQLATLYRNLGDGSFEDVTQTTGAGAGTFRDVTWGNGFVDFDNDGDRDIFIAAGHLQDNVELWDDTGRYMAPNILLMNTGDGKFVNISEDAGSGMKVVLSSRGAGFDDLDNDGDVDVAILNSRREPTILRNDSPSQGHWLGVSLRGIKTNRDGVGAHVKVCAGDLSLIDEVHSGRSYQSHFGMRLHFGLGQRKKIDRIELSWIGGGVDVIENVEADQYITITEGSSTIQRH